MNHLDVVSMPLMYSICITCRFKEYLYDPGDIM